MRRRTGTKREATISVVLVDDHRLIGAGVRAILETETGIKVIAETDSLDVALGVCTRRHPAVVLMDMHVPSPTTVEGLRRLRRQCADCGVVTIIHHGDDEALYQAVLAGASGHVSDDAPPRDLARAIQRVAGGDELMTELLAKRPLLRERVLATLRELPLPGADDEDRQPRLAPRQLAILQYAAQGLTNGEIAQAMGIRLQTVKNQMSNILRRLSVRRRTDAVMYAVERGWIRLPDREHRPPTS